MIRDAAGALEGCQVLVVEDDQMRAMLTDNLVRGYITAVESVTALTEMERHAYALVLVDVLPAPAGSAAGACATGARVCLSSCSRR
jgi:CheY-like chemotaxis protein